MVESYCPVTAVEQYVTGFPVHCRLFLVSGQARFFQFFLSHVDPWHMGIGESHQPVGPYVNCLSDGFGKTFNSLAGQSVYEIKVNTDTGTFRSEKRDQILNRQI